MEPEKEKRKIFLSTSRGYRRAVDWRNSKLDGGGWLGSVPGRSQTTPTQEPWYILSRRMSGPNSRSGRFKGQTNLFAHPGIGTPYVHMICKL